MWYYESNHQSVGPVSVEAIQELLRNGTINALTLVWQEGLPDWKHLGETELGSLARNIPQAMPGMMPPPPSAPLTAAPNPVIVVNGNYRYPRVKSNTLKSLFTWWAVSMALVVVYQVVGNLLPNSSTNVGLACVSEVVILTFAILQFVLLYRFWQIDQDGFASTIPGKAVGFLFIPIFNFYWFFRAYMGLAIDQNRYIARHFESKPGAEVRKAHPLLSLAYLIVSLGGGAVLYSIIFSKVFAAAGSSMNLDAMSAVMDQYALPILIFSLVVTLLGFFMYLDFYLTAKNIVETEEKQ